MLGVLCGMAREAVIIRRALGDAPHRIIGAGANAANARSGAEALLQAGATRLLSFGLAGALDDHLRPGSLLLPEHVIDADNNRWAVDADWRRRVLTGAPEAAAGAILGLDQAAQTPEQKQQLRAGSDAIAVDMESHALAAVAAKAGLPFLVIRAVADDSGQSLPRTAMAALGPDGRLRAAAALTTLAQHPGELGAMIRLGLASRRGFLALSRVAGAGLGLGR